MRLTSRLSLFLLAAAAAFMIPHAAFSHSTQSGDIAVGHIWSYPAQSQAQQAGFFMKGQPAGSTLDIYGPVFNGGNAANEITGVTSPNAGSANIVHWIRGQQMTSNFPMPLPPGKPVAFGPQTQFIRLYGVSGADKAGDKLPITLHFRSAPDATIDVMVQAK